MPGLISGLHFVQFSFIICRNLSGLTIFFLNKVISKGHIGYNFLFILHEVANRYLNINNRNMFG